MATGSSAPATRRARGRRLWEVTVAEEEGVAQQDEGPRLEREGAVEKRVRTS